MSDLELREKVARLLGHTKHSWPYHPATAAGFPQCVHCGEMLFYHEPEKQAGWCYGYNPPPYETDVATAWQVVEFMREKGYVLKLLDQRDHPTNPRWRADFRLDFTHDGDEAFWQGLAPTAPLAICKAFVAAMEGNHES